MSAEGPQSASESLPPWSEEIDAMEKSRGREMPNELRDRWRQIFFADRAGAIENTLQRLDPKRVRQSVYRYGESGHRRYYLPPSLQQEIFEAISQKWKPLAEPKGNQPSNPEVIQERITAERARLKALTEAHPD